MRGDMVSELGLAAQYANQVARAIVLMDDKLPNFFFMPYDLPTITFAIDVLGTPDLKNQNVQIHH